MTLSRLRQTVLKIRLNHVRPTSNIHNAESSVKLWVDDEHNIGKQFVRRSMHDFSCDQKGHVIVTIGEYSAGGPEGIWRHGVSLYWGPQNPLNWVDNITHTALGVTLRKRVAWDSCVGLSLQYSRELNMKAIRTAAETARYIGIDCLTVTTTNYNIINAFNSSDHVGSLLHGFRFGIGSVARKNWYTMISLSGVKIFICRLEHMDTKARVNAIDGQKSGMLKKYGMKKNISPMTRDLIARSETILSKVARKQRINKRTGEIQLYDNIDDLKEEVLNTTNWYLTRQLSADQNIEMLKDHRVSLGLPIIPQHDNSAYSQEAAAQLYETMHSDDTRPALPIGDESGEDLMFEDGENEDGNHILALQKTKESDKDQPKFMTERGNNPEFLEMQRAAHDASDDDFIQDLLDDLDI